MAGIQYLDELFSAIRDTAEQLSIADSWLAKVGDFPHAPWHSSFLQAAREALKAARYRLGEANTQLAALGPTERLPSLLAGMPERLDELRVRIEASERRLSLAWDVVLQKPRGRA